MLIRNKKIQKFVISIIFFSMLVPSFFVIPKPKKAEAFLGFGDIVFDPLHTVVTAKIVAQEIFKQYLIILARNLLNKITQSTVNWINTGNWGNPLYLERPDSFFKDIAKFEVKNLVNLFGYNSLKYPFGKDFSLNLINSYKRQLEDNASYSLSKVINDPNLLERYRNDFNVGGWNGFLINTQYPQNNYIGFQMIATEEAARRLNGLAQNKIQQVQTTLQQGMGFLSPQTCPTNPAYNQILANEFQRPVYKDLQYNPPTDLVYVDEDTLDDASQARLDDYNETYDIQNQIARTDWAVTNDCPGGLVSTTPGSVVANQITSAMGSQFRRGELAQALGNSIAAILDTFINHFLQKGLRSLSDKVDDQGNPIIPPDVNTSLEDVNFGGDTINTINNGDAGAYTGPRPPSGGGGDQCSDTGNQFEGTLRDAENTVLASHPDVGDLPNIESGGRQNARRFLRLVADEIISQGLNASVDVLNGNNNPNTGDAIAIWREGDTVMERYDAINGGASTIRLAATAQFTGFIPLDCTPAGGGRNCGCSTGGTNPVPEPVPPATVTPNIVSVSPTSAVAGQTVITIIGTNLADTVQFFDAAGGTHTVIGSINSGGTQVSATVPSDLPSGSATVRVRKSATSFSNIIGITIGGSIAGAAAPSVDATAGFFGSLAYNSTDNNWFVVSALDQISGRIIGNNRLSVTPEFKINADTGVQVMVPKVAYAPDINKYLVLWIAFDPATIYGRFVNADGSMSGTPFAVFKDTGGASLVHTNSILQYDSRNKKFVFVWEYRHPFVDSNLVTIGETGSVGPVIPLGVNTIGGSWAPSVAINEASNEYCVAYDQRNDGKISVRKVNALTGALGTESSVNVPDAMDTSIVYNTVARKYLIGWSNFGATGAMSQGKILNTCTMSGSSATIAINAAGRTVSIAYNPKSNTYATIVQDQNDFGNIYNILNSTGTKIKEALAFDGSRNGKGGNFSPIIAANTNDGTFGAISAIDYNPTRFTSQLK